jgi:hypothetical protein
MDRHTLLETDLKQLKLPTFVHNYRQFAGKYLPSASGFTSVYRRGPLGFN